MKIIILLNEQYPHGMAATNRTHLYAKGLSELGNNVEILIPGPTEKPGKVVNKQSMGIQDGVRFRYAWGSVSARSFAGRRIQNTFSFLMTGYRMIHSKPDIILVVANNLKYILIARLCATLTGAVIVREKTEVPYYSDEKLTPAQKFRIRREFSMFDGLMVISPALREFFQKDMALKISVIEVPILVDTSLRKHDNELKEVRPNLVYTGSMLDHKDGVITIIRAFSRVLRNYPKLNLIMTGDLERSRDREIILESIEKENLGDHIELPGYVAQETLREISSTATALLLAKPGNRQNRYNMATKTGEYLMTGRPVVVSSVDPVCRYLAHGENAFITEPDEASIADQIRFILDNPGNADSVGDKGKKAVAELFDYHVHASRLNDFFRQLVSGKRRTKHNNAAQP